MPTLIDCVNGVGQQVSPFFVFSDAWMLDGLMEGPLQEPVEQCQIQAGPTLLSSQSI